MIQILLDYDNEGLGKRRVDDARASITERSERRGVMVLGSAFPLWVSGSHPLREDRAKSGTGGFTVTGEGHFSENLS